MADNVPVRVLLLEDDPDDYCLTRELIADIPGANIVLAWTDDAEAALADMERSAHDAYLVDYRLGPRDGLEIVCEAIRRGCRAPMILLTGQRDRELALKALQAGAADYLVKGESDALMLERSIRYALQQRRHAEELERKVAERTAQLERSNRALKTTESELRDANRKKDEFLATLAHELRNPLAPLRNALQLIRLAEGNGGAVEEARLIMERQLGQMIRLIDDLLDVSRISHGKVTLKKQAVELQRVIEQALETSRPFIEGSDHALTVSLPAAPVLVEADEVRLAQVFSNLLNNAAKYTDPGGHIALTVELGAEVVVRVKDTGVGIPEAMLPKVFELFAQADQSLERSRGGLGIGLTLVKQLVEMHGGSIAAHSEGRGKGSEFVVRLPAVRQPAARQAPPCGQEKVSVPDSLRVLVVDDNQDSAKSLSMLLRIMGNDAQNVHDGPSALEVAADFRPDVMLLDIGLPGLNGYDVCRKVREAAWGKDVFMVAITGWGNEGDRKRSEEVGFNAHLVKPVDHADLMKTLADVPAQRL